MNATDFKALRHEYVDLFRDEGVAEGVVAEIENALEVKLPEDLQKISEFYAGGILGGISHHALAKGLADNIIQETRRLRESIKLPMRFVVLAEPPESLVLLDTESQRSGGPAVIWFNANETSKLPAIQNLTSPDTWPFYSDFFAHLLRVERDERQ